MIDQILVGVLVGLGFGIFLQKGRFCFVSAFRDFIAYKDQRVLSGVTIGVLVMMVGVSVAYALGTPADHFWVPSFGLSGLIGGFIFGVGMTLAGGCASGTLYRAGEGYVHFWLTLVTMALGYVLFGSLFDQLFLPYYFQPLLVFAGFSPFLAFKVPPPAISFTIVGLVVLAYVRVAGWKKVVESIKRRTISQENGNRVGLLERLREPWDARLCGAGIGLLAVAWFVYATAWSVTNPEARWVGYLLSLIAGRGQVELNQYWNHVIFAGAGPRVTTDMVMLTALVLGSFLSAYLSRDFKLRMPLPRRIPNAVGGGILMAFGSRMAPGCNISNSFSGIAMLSAHSMVVTLGLILGVYLVTHLMFREVGCAI